MGRNVLDLTEREALVAGARHFLSMAETARLAGRRELWRQCMTNAAKYRRDLASY